MHVSGSSDTSNGLPAAVCGSGMGHREDSGSPYGNRVLSTFRETRREPPASGPVGTSLSLCVTRHRRLRWLGCPDGLAAGVRRFWA